MQKYVPSTLQINEKILLTPQLHWAVYFDIFFSFCLIYIILCDFMNNYILVNVGYSDAFQYAQIFIALAIFTRIIYLFIRNFSTEMAITNHRVIYKIGIFNVKTDELASNKLESISVQQSILGRILNYGDILFSGTGTSKLVFKRIYAPWWIKAQVEDIIQQSYFAFSA